MPTGGINWTELNQSHLIAAIAGIRSRLEPGWDAGSEAVRPPAGESPTALDTLALNFGLSLFERQLLTLCAAVELDAAMARLCAEANGDPSRPYPTFSLALAVLAEPHWSALTPVGPLRRWRLIEVAGPQGTPLTASPLRIDERILHFLTGIEYLDDRLSGLMEMVCPPDDQVPSHRELSRQIAAAWPAAGPPPIIQLWGGDGASRRLLAAAGCAAIGLQLLALSSALIPAGAGEMHTLLALWERETMLIPSALYIDAELLDPADAHAAIVTRWMERVQGCVFLGARDRWRPLRRPAISFEVRKPAAEEQAALWVQLLEGAVSSAHIYGLVSQFNLTAPAIREAVRTVLAAGARPGAMAGAVWDASRSQARPRLDDLAQRIEAAATLEDLVLPEAEKRQLLEISMHVAQRGKVYNEWGFASKGSRGLGISALFAGASGTGKTMAAEGLANSLRLDLYRIDLSSVVSKYIGETEKNLRRVFDAAEDGGAILFFDEADALFGKRGEVKDSHDRYANIEINYLLQRMESYQGLTVLATNMKSALDTAFLRRIRFVVNFPFPDAVRRAEIWRRIFPELVPREGLDLGQLARLSLTGGNIRNIAVNAAFLAADAGEPVRMAHLARAARGEFAKMERPLSESEIGAWQ